MKNYRLDFVVASTFILCALATSAQTPPPSPEPGMLQRKMQQMQQAMAANEQQLHTYQWIEATTVTTDGKALPPKQSICRYASDGTVLKTPLGSQEAQSGGQRGGPLRHLIADDKKKKITEDIEETRALSQLYLPFNQARFKEALHSGKVGVEHDGPDGDTIVLSDYAKPSDQLRLTLNKTLQISRISVKTYFDKPKDVMTVDLNFSTLPDGTLYPALNSINAPSKKLSIATVNSSFSKPMN
jgi:hypothetical protein